MTRRMSAATERTIAHIQRRLAPYLSATAADTRGHAGGHAAARRELEAAADAAIASADDATAELETPAPRNPAAELRRELTAAQARYTDARMMGGGAELVAAIAAGMGASAAAVADDLASVSFESTDVAPERLSIACAPWRDRSDRGRALRVVAFYRRRVAEQRRELAQFSELAASDGAALDMQRERIAELESDLARMARAYDKLEQHATTIAQRAERRIRELEARHDANVRAFADHIARGPSPIVVFVPESGS